jgi:nucleoid DNA-binding protein
MGDVTRDVLGERLVEWVESNDGEISIVAARLEITWFFDTIASALAAGDEVRIHRFGTLKTAQRAARVGRNPRTGETVQVAARRVARFSPSTTLAAALKDTRTPGRRVGAKR